MYAQTLVPQLRACDGALRSLRGGAAVLALCPRWPSAMPGEALRAELRGLGATLVVLTPEGGLLLRPDDDPELLCPAPELWRQHGAREAAPVLVLLDAQGRVRLRRSLDAAADAEAALGRALREAGRTMRATPRGVGRRELLVAALAAAITAAVLDACAGAQRREEESPQKLSAPGAGMVDVTLIVNGEKRALRIEPRVTLLDALRENLGLTGTKKGCDMGQCGACTVLVEGKRVDSCLALAVQHDGRKITTIEGLAKGNELHPMQAAFLELDALQCGYCTPGQILSAVALLEERRPASDEEIRERMSGNLCRCGAYPNIVAAIRSQAGRS